MRSISAIHWLLFCFLVIVQCRDTDNSEWELVGEELDRWQRGYLDVDQLCNTVQHSTQQTSRLNKQLASAKDDLQVRFKLPPLLTFHR